MPPVASAGVSSHRLCSPKRPDRFQISKPILLICGAWPVPRRRCEKLPSTANHKNKNGGCPITPAVRESSIVLQTVYQLLHNTGVGLFQSINKVTVIDRSPAAGIAPLVHAGGQHRALPAVGIVHARDQAPIG